MRNLEKILMSCAMVIGLSMAVSAQRNDDQKKPPPKETPPVVNPQQKNPPPRENKPKKPDYSLVVYRSDNESRLA
jgi:hypothetical protein